MAFFLDQFDFTTGEYYAGDGVYLDLTDDEISNLVDDYSEQEQTPKPRLPRPSPPTYEEIIEKRETSNKDMVLKLKKLGLYEAPKKKNKKRAEPFAKQVFDLFEQDDFYETLDYQQNVFESLRWNGKFKGKLNKEGYFKSEDYNFPKFAMPVIRKHLGMIRVWITPKNLINIWNSPPFSAEG